MILPNINGRSRKSLYKKILTTTSSFSNYISSFNRTENNFSKPKKLIRNTKPFFPNVALNLDNESNNTNPLNRNLSHVKFPYKPQQIIKDNRPIKSKIIKKNKNNIEIQIDSDFSKGNKTSNDFYKFSRQYEKDISNLIYQRLNNKLKSQYYNNYNNNSYNSLNNNSNLLNHKNFIFINNENELEKFRMFMLKKNDEDQMRLYSSKIIQSLENQKNKEEKKDIRKLNISDNYYFDKIINRVVRKVAYYSNKNEKFNEDFVMNMLFDEGKFLEIETNKQMELYCKIKNFSSVVLQNDYKKQLIPLINKVRPLTEADMKYMAEEIYKTQLNYQKNPDYYNNLNNNINNLNLTNSNYFNKNNSNLSKDKNKKDIINLKSNLTLDDELPIGGGGIWDLYNKAHNIKKEGGPIKNFGITINDNRTTTYKYDQNGNIITTEEAPPVNTNPNYTYSNRFPKKISNNNSNQNQMNQNINQNQINQNINQNQINQNITNQNQTNQNQTNQDQIIQNQINQNQINNNKSALSNFYKHAINNINTNNNNNANTNTIYNNTTNLNSTNISYTQNGKLIKKLNSHENKTNDIIISDEENTNRSKNKLIKRKKTKEEISEKIKETNEQNNQKRKNKRNRNNSENLKENIESKKSTKENNDYQNIKIKHKKQKKKSSKKEVESESEAYDPNIDYEQLAIEKKEREEKKKKKKEKKKKIYKKIKFN